MRQLVTDFVSVVRELSLDDLRDAAQLAPRFLIVGDSGRREAIARPLFGPEAAGFLTFADSVPTAEVVAFDLVIVVWAGGEAMLREAVGSARRRGWPVVVAAIGGQPLPSALVGAGEVLAVPTALDGDWESARGQLVAVLDESRRLALGRFLPGFRPLVAQSLIQLTARANAQFAALSSLPALIPVLGNLIGAAGDFLVLTKNQLILIFKLAAVHGRSLEDRRQIYVEMVPVVGAAFLWRTVARQLIALVPGLLGAVPKVAVAYSGTYVVGRAAQFYYREGRAPRREEWRRFYDQAVARVQQIKAGVAGE